jgi:hypothetical protein
MNHKNGALQWSLWLPTMDYASVTLTAYAIAEAKGYKSFAIERNDRGNALSFYDAADHGHSFSRIDCPKLREIVRSECQDLFDVLEAKGKAKKYFDEAPYYWDHREENWRNFKRINPVFLCDMRYPEDLNVY